MVTKFIECPHDDVMGLCIKFGYDMSKGCRDMSSLPVWRAPEFKGHQIVWMSPEGCHESMYQVWLWYCNDLAGDITMLKKCWEQAYFLFGQVWLAVTAKRFWIWESCLTPLFSLVWRSYMPSFLKIGHNLWPVEIYNWFWQLSTWRPSSDVAMRSNFKAI